MEAQLANWQWVNEPLGGQRLALDNADRKFIIRVLWAPQWLDELEPEELETRIARFDPYFDFFLDSCRYLVLQHHGVGTYGELMRLIHWLKLNWVWTLPLVWDLKLKPGEMRRHNAITDVTHERNVKRSISLGVYLWLMVKINDIGAMPTPGIQRPLYPSDQSKNLNEILINHCKVKEGLGDGQEEHFDGFYTLRDMEHLGGIEIKWTSNLLEHLHLVSEKESKRRRTLYIFHNATVLEELLDTNIPMLNNLAKETLQTLGLILPDWPKCRMWYKRRVAERYKRQERLDPWAAEQEIIREKISRELHHYTYWNERLYKLQNEFNNSDHASFPVYVIDRRRPRAWATLWATIGAFWFAVLAFFIAIISLLYGQKSVDEAKFANSMAFNASTSADMAAASNSMSITCCCTANSNSSVYYNSLFTQSFIQNSTLAPGITVTKFISATITTSLTTEITSTVVVTRL